MTRRVENNVTYTQTWDVENRLTVVTGTAAGQGCRTCPPPTSSVSKFVYDGDGARVMQVQISSTQVITTAYAGAIEVQITATQRITKAYYYAGSQLVATPALVLRSSAVQVCGCILRLPPACPITCTRIIWAAPR